MKKGYIYYAHSMRIYNKPQEKAERDCIEKNYDELVLCPNRDALDSWKHSTGVRIMVDCLDFVRKAEFVVCSEYMKYVGQGVYDEVKTALECEKKVYVIRKWRFKRVYDVVINNSTDWKITYGKLITKKRGRCDV